MLAPMAVDVLQQNSAHERRELLDADHIQFFLENIMRSFNHFLQNVFIGDGLRLFDQL